MEREKEGCLPFWTSWLSVRQVATYPQQGIVSQPIQIDTSTLDQNTLYSINSQSLTLFSNEPKNFPPQPRPEQRTEIRETNSLVEWLSEMDI